MTQHFIGHFFSGAEIILTVVMAICKPLHYLAIMNQKVCVLLLSAWVGGFLYAVVQLLFVHYLPFCGPKVIYHLICEVPLVKTSLH